jgi:hypothetical protein
VSASQQGRRNRNAGHTFERDLATFLSVSLDLDVVTARSLSGGTAIGADLATVLERDQAGRPTASIPTVHGWSVEAKASTGPHKVTQWMRQARAQSDSRLYVVVAKRPHRPVQDACVYLTGEALWWWISADSGEDRSVRMLDLVTWVDLLHHLSSTSGVTHDT